MTDNESRAFGLSHGFATIVDGGLQTTSLNVRSGLRVTTTYTFERRSMREVRERGLCASTRRIYHPLLSLSGSARLLPPGSRPRP